jgi:hypothetical protein
MPRFYVQEGISIESATTENGWAAELPKESPGDAARADATLLETRSMAKSVELGMTMSGAWRLR